MGIVAGISPETRIENMKKIHQIQVIGVAITCIALTCLLSLAIFSEQASAPLRITIPCIAVPSFAVGFVLIKYAKQISKRRSQNVLIV